MAMSAAAAKAPVEAPAGEAKKKNKLSLILAIVVVLLGLAGGAATWWFLNASADEDDEAEAVASRRSIFLPLEQFTVNLQPEEGQQYLQTTLTLKVSEQDVVDNIKAQMPEVRSRLLFLLSSKKPSELSSVEGKNKLVQEIIHEVEDALPPVKTKAKKKSRKKAEEAKAAKKGKKAKAKADESDEPEEEPAPSRVLAVYFTHFIIQ